MTGTSRGETLLTLAFNGIQKHVRLGFLIAEINEAEVFGEHLPA